MTLYIEVDDLAAYRKRIGAAGGKIHVEEQEVPAMGAFTLFTDPEGRMMGLWKGAKGNCFVSRPARSSGRSKV